jgi:uncharacterized membrane protein YbaN (DUF454 family)
MRLPCRSDRPCAFRPAMPPIPPRIALYGGTVLSAPATLAGHRGPLPGVASISRSRPVTVHDDYRQAVIGVTAEFVAPGDSSDALDTTFPAAGSLSSMRRELTLNGAGTCAPSQNGSDMPPIVIKLIWRSIALASLLLGLVGLLLPLLPTVPFMLVAAWAAGHGWPALEIWLLGHARLGPPLRRWRDRGSVPRRAKWMASLAMVGSGLVLFLTPLPTWLKASALAAMVAVAVWLWRRPET